MNVYTHNMMPTAVVVERDGQFFAVSGGKWAPPPGAPARAGVVASCGRLGRRCPGRLVGIRGATMFVQFTRLDGRKVSVNAANVLFVSNVAHYGDNNEMTILGGCEIVFGEAMAIDVQESRETVEQQLGAAILAHAAICGGN